MPLTTGQPIFLKGQMVSNLQVHRPAIARNSMLNSLEASDFELLAPLLQEIYLDGGELLSGGENEQNLVYFPVTMVACLSLHSHRSGLCLIGREGMIGWPAMYGSNGKHYRASVILGGGLAFAIRGESMRRACEASPTLAMHLMKFFQRYTLELSGRLQASGRSSLKQRLSAWLLMILDRTEENFLPITHDVLAVQLAVRRASITGALHLLEEDTSLRCERGRIFVRDRNRLEASAGTAYGHNNQWHNGHFAATGICERSRLRGIVATEPRAHCQPA